MPAEDVAPATSAVPADVAIAELAAARERSDVAAIVRVMRAHVPLADVQARPCARPLLFGLSATTRQCSANARASCAPCATAAFARLSCG